MRQRSQSTLPAVIAAATLTLPGSIAAQAQADTSDWKCELCPFAEGYRADVEAGASYVSDDAARFGNASGYDEKGTYAIFEGEGSYAGGGNYLDWYVEDLGLDSRMVEIAGGRQGRFELALGYRELPYRLYDTTRTIFAAAAPDNLVLPSGWIPAGTTGGFTRLGATLARQDIESDRKVLELGARYLPAERFSLFADYRRQERDGADVLTGSSYTQASYLPRPIDHHTDEVDLGARYRYANFDVTLAYYGSFFRNNIDALTWDNPFIAAPGAEQGRMAREPDNDFQRLSLNGSYRAATFDTVVAFSAGVGLGEQDATLLPYTINPNIAAAPLPRASAEAEVDSANFGFTVTSKPLDIVRVKLAYRYDERDNTTPQVNWSRTIVDTFTSGDAEPNTLWSFDRSRLNLGADVQALDDLTLSAGYDRKELNRDNQEVARQTEDSGWGQLRWKPAPYLDLNLRAGAAKRDIDSYSTNVADSFGQNPLLRKYNLAYRYREFGELNLFASMPERPVSLSLSLLYADDSYTHSALGMTDSSEAQVAADFSWNLSEKASVHVHGGTEEIDADQLGSEAFAAADWQARHEDRFRYLGGGLQWSGIADKLDLVLDYTSGKATTGIDVTGAAAAAPGALTELRSDIDSLDLDLRYRWSDRLDVSLYYRYEHYDADDWALDGVAEDTLATILTMGADAFDYDVSLVGLSFRYRVGSRQIEFPE